MMSTRPEDDAEGTMSYEKFDVTKLERLNDPARLERIPPMALWSALGDPTVETIVEIGAGTGVYAEQFARICPGAVVYAADIEPSMVDYMNTHRGSVVPLLAEETSVPLPDGEAGAVVMINLHHELVDPAATYREAWRLLRPGGIVLVTDWAPGGEAGPPQEIRADAERIGDILAAAGFGSIVVHDPLPTHSVVTGLKDGTA
jgi:SAM-dependent methyltransferase